MLLRCIRFLLCTLILVVVGASCDVLFRQNVRSEQPATPALPFPTCNSNDIECLRRGLRTFFILMDSGYVGMKPIDPVIVNSVAISLPEEQTSFLLRRANVTGTKWTRLADRKFYLRGGKSGVTFNTDLHVTGEFTMLMASRLEPYIAHLTMDIENVETNITYNWFSERRIDKEDYIFIGPERIAVRNMRLPTFFLQPNSEDSSIIEHMLQSKQSILDHISNEITAAVMHDVVDNFRLFASKVPIKYYYNY
ncbi:uncharacterized protein LOC113509873 [Galleria mellonella]|uniref:Uncharacterized protein LOC113509873 n=1 Tax=Galleria mellonella TaxID=7137 RepID=A0A6J1WG91_GALME|nr:uncharacterized protein LOC113509873 [Galleria mellonella]